MLMALLLLFPISVDAVHFFNHDTHNHCTEIGDTHVHQIPVECELCDVQLTQILTIPKVEYNEVATIPFTHIDNVHYTFLGHSFHQTAHYLRGPPQQ